MSQHEVPDFSVKKFDTLECASASAALFSPAPPDVRCTHQIVRHAIPDDMLDFDATKVVRRLNRFGYEAYLVGGCVRDILFGKRPKDFDMATSALPGEMKRLFRNCRLIGRRFRLAHLLFKNGKIVEVATFRRGATSEDDISLRHAAENLFGGPADDAIRRDFTINALMYDVNRREIHDYVGGLKDIQAGLLNTIGDPDRRFSEDPVRIIRAVKFQQRLDLSLGPGVEEAMRRHAPLVSNCSSARLVEEIYKVFHSGKSARCFAQLRDLGVLTKLMPGLANRMVTIDGDGDPWRYLDRIDARVRSGSQISEVVILATLLFPFCRPEFAENGDLAERIHALLHSLTIPMQFPKRCMAGIRQMIVAQPTLAVGPVSQRARRILKRDYAADALDLMDMIADNGELRENHDKWLAIYNTRQAPEKKPCDERRPPCRRNRRDARRRRRESSDHPIETPRKEGE